MKICIMRMDAAYHIAVVSNNSKDRQEEESRAHKLRIDSPKHSVSTAHNSLLTARFVVIQHGMNESLTQAWIICTGFGV